MAATDKLRKYKSLYSSTCNTFATGEGVTITPASVVGLPTDTEITLTFDRVDASGNKTPAKMERILGKIIGGNFVVSSGGRAVEGTEQTHTAPVVEMVFNAYDYNDLIDTFLIGFNQDGTLKDNTVLTTPVINGGDALTSTSTELNLLDGVTSIVSQTGTETLTNKRITKRIGTVASSATPTPDSDAVDEYTVTALAAGATFGAPSGTPTNGQTLVIRIKDNGTARALDFNAAYRFSTDLPKPTTTVVNKTMYLGFMWNSTDSKWDCLAILDNF